MHKLTLQAMWCIVMPQLLDFIGSKSISLKEKILEKSVQGNCLVELIRKPQFFEYTSMASKEK